MKTTYILLCVLMTAAVLAPTAAAVPGADICRNGRPIDDAFSGRSTGCGDDGGDLVVIYTGPHEYL